MQLVLSQWRLSLPDLQIWIFVPAKNFYNVLFNICMICFVSCLDAGECMMITETMDPGSSVADQTLMIDQVISLLFPSYLNRPKVVPDLTLT